MTTQAESLHSYGIVNVMWQLAGCNEHGRDIGCVVADATSDSDAADGIKSALIEALRSESDWTGDAGGGDCGRIDEHAIEGDPIYWWGSKDDYEWSQDKPDWWVEA